MLGISPPLRQPWFAYSEMHLFLQLFADVQDVARLWNRRLLSAPLCLGGQSVSAQELAEHHQLRTTLPNNRQQDT